MEGENIRDGDSRREGGAIPAPVLPKKEDMGMEGGSGLFLPPYDDQVYQLGREDASCTFLVEHTVISSDTSCIGNDDKIRKGTRALCATVYPFLWAKIYGTVIEKPYCSQHEIRYTVHNTHSPVQE